MGLLPQTDNNFIGIQYLFRSLSTDHPEEGGDPATILNEKYQTYQVWGRYSINNKVQLFAFLPYIVNVRDDNGEKSTISGVGDVSILANVKLLNRTNGNWKQTLLAGGGLKMPTGKYDRDAIATEEGLPNMQPGTHSWDIVTNANYTAQYKAIGAHIDASYVITTANSDGYKFGNRANIGASAFYRLAKNEFVILPHAGMRYEQAATDYADYSEKIKDDTTGGYQTFVTAGVQAYYHSIGMQVQLSLPVTQHYASGLVSTWYKAEAGIMFLF